MNIKRIKNITSCALICILMNNTFVEVVAANESEISTINTIESSTYSNILQTGIVKSDTLNVRVKADADSKKIGAFKKGDKVEIVSKKTSNGWYKVKYKDTYGYLNGYYLKDIKNVNSSSSTESNSTTTSSSAKVTMDVNLRKTASWSGVKLMVIKKGATVEVVSKGSEWTKVKYNGTTGYVTTQYVDMNIKEEEDTTIKVTHTGVVKSDTLNVRVKADADSKKIGAFKKGDKVEIVSKKTSNGWYKVKYKDTYGYLNGSYLKDIKSVSSSNNNTVVDENQVIRTGVVNVETIEVREKASIESNLKGNLTKDTLVEIVKIESNGWYKIKFDKDFGYVQQEFIDLNRNANTTVTGLKTSLTQTAGKSLTDSIEVVAAYGRKVKLQMYNTANKKWETKVTFKTENTEKSTVKLKYPSQWYDQVSSKWRIVIDAKDELKSYKSSTINVKAKRVYENPSGYIQLKEKITVSGAGKNLVKGTMGLRVAKVQRKLGLGRIWEKVDTKTMNAVKNFQRKNGLSATGVVDLKTWKKLGFSESEWYSLDSYVTPVKTKLTATRKDLIEQMIATAESYLGTEYVVGAAGKPGTGIDCSGLVMQALYSIGIDPAPVSVVRHTQPGYEYESRNLWNLKTLKTVSKPQRGDLVFYKNSSGVIIHVAIYLGNNRVIESWPEKVVNWPLIHSSRPLIKGYKRVLG